VAQALSPFVVVQVADAPVHDCWRPYRATRVTPEKKTDVFFYSVSFASAKETIRRLHPNATFADEVA
jgi:hypothetical protein